MKGRSARRRLFALGVLAGMLAGCAVPPVAERGGEEARKRLWTSRLTRLRALGRWHMEGRVAVRQGEQGWQASLTWDQDQDVTQIEVFDPLGRRVARLLAGPAGVRLLARGESPRRAQTPEALMRAVLGWSLPVAGLRWWLLGIPDPAQPVQGLELDEHGRATALVQAGWVLRYKQYERWDGRDLPVRAELAQGGVRVRVLVTQWRPA